MTADVGPLSRFLGSYSDSQRDHSAPYQNPTAVIDFNNSGGSPSSLITRDFLGGGSSSSASSSSSGSETQVLDLDLKVPSGFEKRLDLKSGKVYLHKCNTSNPSVSPTKQTKHQKLQDLNFPPSSSSEKIVSSSMELNLFPSPSPSYFQSVCTLDSVKSALERANRQPTNNTIPPLQHQRPKPPIKASMEESSSSGLFATGCPNCLLYVLISKNNPKCPRCHTVVAVSSPSNMVEQIAKKPRIDLNLSE